MSEERDAWKAAPEHESIQGSSKREKATDQKEWSREAPGAGLSQGVSVEIGRSCCGQPGGWWDHSPPPSPEKAKESLEVCG